MGEVNKRNLGKNPSCPIWEANPDIRAIDGRHGRILKNVVIVLLLS